MGPITWDPEKNSRLQNERDVSFEDVVSHIFAGGILNTFEHPNQARYPGQEIHVIEIEGCAYVVPFVEGRSHEGR